MNTTMTTEEKKSAIASKTAKGGFLVEIECTAKINNYKNDTEAQQWLYVWGVNPKDVQTIKAVHIPNTFTEKSTIIQNRELNIDYNMFKKLEQGENESIDSLMKREEQRQKIVAEFYSFKKTDVQITITDIYGKIYVINLTIKSFAGRDGFNQLDRRYPIQYQKDECITMTNEVRTLLELRTGKTLPNEHNSIYFITPEKIKNYIHGIKYDEFKRKYQDLIKNFLTNNRDRLISLGLKGLGDLAATHLLVVKKIGGKRRYKMISIEEAIDILLFEFPVEFSKSMSVANIAHGITLQRKGSKKDKRADHLQLKIKLSTFLTDELSANNL